MISHATGSPRVFQDMCVLYRLSCGFASVSNWDGTTRVSGVPTSVGASASRGILQVRDCAPLKKVNCFLIIIVGPFRLRTIIIILEFSLILGVRVPSGDVTLVTPITLVAPRGGGFRRLRPRFVLCSRLRSSSHVRVIVKPFHVYTLKGAKQLLVLKGGSKELLFQP